MADDMPSLAPAPLFRDPIFDGAADPTVIWNHREQSWWLVYTNRRANVACRGVSWVHGTDLGVASSRDGGVSWVYRGTLNGLSYEPGRNSYWAPEILRSGGLYHMYVSYVPGVPHDWSGPRHILHYTSDDLWEWEFDAKLNLSSDRVIDACVHRLPDGLWRMWYKDEAGGSHTMAADSADLRHWEVRGPVITDCGHEGPNVFRRRGTYWMITDTWKGLGVYRSADAESWTRCPDILGTPGTRRDDGSTGHHADVLTCGDRAYLFYFTHPDRGANPVHYGFDEVHPFEYKRTSVQVAELGFPGDRIECDRNRAPDMRLAPPTGDEW